MREVKEKSLKTTKQTKKYQLVFDKRIVDLQIFHSYSYGFDKAEFDNMDMDNICLLTLNRNFICCKMLRKWDVESIHEIDK